MSLAKQLGFVLAGLCLLLDVGEPAYAVDGFLIEHTNVDVRAYAGAYVASMRFGTDSDSETDHPVSAIQAVATAAAQISAGNDELSHAADAEAAVSLDNQPLLQAISAGSITGLCDAGWDFDEIYGASYVSASATATGVVLQQVGSGGTTDATLQIRISFGDVISTGAFYSTGSLISHEPVLNGALSVDDTLIVQLYYFEGICQLTVLDPMTGVPNTTFPSVVNGVISEDIPIQLTDEEVVSVSSSFDLEYTGEGWPPVFDSAAAIGSYSMTITTVPQP